MIYRKVKYGLYSMFLLVFLLSPLLSHAQIDRVRKDQINELNSIGSGGQVYPVISKTHTSGSPYLNKNFVKGYVMINKDTKSNDVYLRYNIYKNIVEFLRDDELLASDPKKIYGFSMHTNGKDVKFRNGYHSDLKSITPSTLLRVAYQGDTKLLVQYDVSLNEDIASYGSASKSQKFTKFITYYLVTSDGDFHKIEEAKQDVPKILGKDAQNYAASKALNFNSEKDLIKILQHHDNS